MTRAKLIDYYKLLAVPPDADIIGIENAYVRLSDELVQQAEHDPAASDALNRLNEAYAVLSDAEARRKYDRVLFAAEYEALERRLAAEARRRSMIRSGIVAGLSAVIVVQAAVLGYMGRDYLSDAIRFIQAAF